MNTSTISERFIPQALNWLENLARQRTEPSRALNELTELCDQAPELNLGLVWESAGLDQAIHYDLLVTQSDGTISLSYCPASEIPWPLRGAQQWSDNYVVRVNGELLDVEMLMAKLDFVWSDSSLLTRLVDECLIRQEVSKRGIRLSDAELQEAMNDFRMRRGLLRSEDTRRWMVARGLSHARLERHVEAQTQAEKLKQEIAGGREAAYFEGHRDEFDEVSVAVIRTVDVRWLLSLKDELLDAGRDQWFAPIQAAVREGGLNVRDFACKRLRRTAVDDGVKRRVPSASFYESIKGPSRIGSAYELIIILVHHPAVFDDSVRKACRDSLFEAWLREQREKADVEWFWGPSS